MWITHYVQALNKLAPPLPAQAALTGPRAAGFTLDDTMEIVVVVDARDKPSLQTWLANIAADASEKVPSVQPSISIVSSQQWDQQRAHERSGQHYNVWLAQNPTE